MLQQFPGIILLYLSCTLAFEPQVCLSLINQCPPEIISKKKCCICSTPISIFLKAFLTVFWIHQKSLAIGVVMQDR